MVARRADESIGPYKYKRSTAENQGLNPLSLRKAQTAPLDAIKGSLWADRVVGPCIVRLFQAFFLWNERKTT